MAERDMVRNKTPWDGVRSHKSLGFASVFMTFDTILLVFIPDHIPLSYVL